MRRSDGRYRSKATALVLAAALAIAPTVPAWAMTADGANETAENATAKKEDDAIHEVLSASTSRQERSFYADEARTNRTQDTEDITRKLEHDKAGNVTKETSTDTYEVKSIVYSILGQTVETTRTYTRDKQGWPIKVETASKMWMYQRTDEGQNDFEPKSTSTTTDYTYEKDADGHVTKATSSDETQGTVEISYDADGNVSSMKHTFVSYVKGTPTDEESDAGTSIDAEETTEDKQVPLNTTETIEMHPDGTVGKINTTWEDGESKQVSRRERTYDDDGNILSDTYHDPQKKDEVTGSKEYAYKKDKDGKVIQYKVTNAAGEVTQVKYVLDEASNRIGQVTLYANGNKEVQRSKFDGEGNTTEATSVAFDEERSEAAESTVSNEYQRVDEPSEYLQSSFHKVIAW